MQFSSLLNIDLMSFSNCSADFSMLDLESKIINN